VRRLIGWTAGLVGIAALARLLAARRTRAEAPTTRPTVAQDPADELRRKLAETRPEPDGADPPPEPSAEREPLAERRARVHAKAQEAVAAMDALEEPPS
jgi:hypothetical protein